jgi:hypothetical protein
MLQSAKHNAVHDVVDVVLWLIMLSRYACKLSRYACKLSRYACKLSRYACKLSRYAMDTNQP